MGQKEVWLERCAYAQSLGIAELGHTSVVWVGTQVCPGSGGSRSRLFDMDFGKLAFMSCVIRPTSSSLRGPFPLALTLLGGARFIVWCLRYLFVGECQ